MKENFLHYLWEYQIFAKSNLHTTNNEPIEIYKIGEHNPNSGPDFFNGKVKISNQVWAGNIEIHVKSSDWYIHGHEKDENYDNVILHVVWINDIDIFHKNNTVIPALELKSIIPKNILIRHENLFSKKLRWINCENHFRDVDNFVLNNWMEVLYFERLMHKSTLINKMLNASNNDWEAVLFLLLTKNFGLKINGDAFLNLANSINYKIVRKEREHLVNLEALFFGQSGFLEGEKEDVYYINLQQEYNYLRLKYNLEPLFNGQFKFFRLRPSNFPTIRLAQLAMLINTRQNLFSEILAAKTLEDFYNIFMVKTDSYWENHYSFNTISKKSSKKITKSFIHLLLINSIIPLRFIYNKYMGTEETDFILNLLQKIPAEKNEIIKKFEGLINFGEKNNFIIDNALKSQALIQLKTTHCKFQKCLQCAIGNSYLKKAID